MQEVPANATRPSASPDLAEGEGKFTSCERGLSPDAGHVDLVSTGKPRQVSDLTALRRRVAAGDALTDEERARINQYYARYTRQKKAVHLKGDREKRWVDLASRQGISLSSWIQERVEDALRGPGDALQELRDENQRLRDEVTVLRGASGHLAVENSKLQSRLEALEANLMEAMGQALRLADGRA